MPPWVYMPPYYPFVGTLLYTRMPPVHPYASRTPVYTRIHTYGRIRHSFLRDPCWPASQPAYPSAKEHLPASEVGPPRKERCLKDGFRVPSKRHLGCVSHLSTGAPRRPSPCPSERAGRSACRPSNRGLLPCSLRA